MAGGCGDGRSVSARDSAQRAPAERCHAPCTARCTNGGAAAGWSARDGALGSTGWLQRRRRWRVRDQGGASCRVHLDQLMEPRVRAVLGAPRARARLRRLSRRRGTLVGGSAHQMRRRSPQSGESAVHGLQDSSGRGSQCALHSGGRDGQRLLPTRRHAHAACRGAAAAAHAATTGIARGSMRQRCRRRPRRRRTVPPHPSARP